MKIMITMNVDPEYADPDHDMGVTEEGYNQINDRLADLGDDINVIKA